MAGPIVILGGGLAGGKAVQTLRAEGFDARLVMIGEEAELPFGRPPLSKTYLRGEEDLSGWVVEPATWYEENQVEIVPARAVAVDAGGQLVRLESGDTVAYDKLLVATGGRNRRLEVEGAELPGILQLRTKAECDAIRAAAEPGAHALIVGMGFIGSEVAASLRQMGVRVTAILGEPSPLDRVLGAEVGKVLAGIHAGAGVELIANDGVVAFHGSERVGGVTTRAGLRIDCDFAIVAVGIQPNTEVLADSGLAIDDGLLVDGSCRTADEHVFAAGDVANHLHPVFGRIRVEHYNNAEKQGVSAARSMLATGGPYDYIHTFWSDQYEHKLEYAGHARHWDRFVIRGSLEDAKFVGFYLEADRLKAAVGLNRGGDPEMDQDDELAKASKLIAGGSPVSAKDLADEAIALDSLL